MSQNSVKVREFAENVDAVVEEVCEKISIKEILNKSAPVMKMMGLEDVSVLSIRNMMYQLVMKSPKESIEFIKFLHERLESLLSDYGDIKSLDSSDDFVLPNQDEYNPSFR